jgi:hypothetical protein
LPDCGKKLFDRETEVTQKRPIDAKLAAESYSINKGELLRKKPSGFLREPRQPDAAGQLVLRTREMHRLCAYDAVLFLDLAKQSTR